MDDLAQARQLMVDEKLAFALVRDGTVIARGADYGVVELLAAIRLLGLQARGASLADKVIGKAVAMIAAHAGFRAVTTPVASEAAIRVLQAHGIAHHVTTVVPTILNRRGDGSCPMEQLMQPLEDPAEAVTQLGAFIAARRSAPAPAAN